MLSNVTWCLHDFAPASIARVSLAHKAVLLIFANESMTPNKADHQHWLGSLYLYCWRPLSVCLPFNVVRMNKADCRRCISFHR